jgi:diguanylate cyclase (GGDEF)-like protein
MSNQLLEAQRIAHVGSWQLDLVSNKLVWSDEIFRIFESDPTHFEATNEAFLAAIHPEDRDAVNAACRQSLETRQPYSITHRLLMPDGRIKYVHGQCESVFDAGGKPLRSMGTMQDITERKQLELELTKQAHLDYLTGLYNRRHFMEQGVVELSRAIRYGTPLSLLMLDIDFFKNVNDTYGHQVGDTVLQALSKVCQDSMRQVDVVGRLGGEEFAVILPETRGVEALDVAERLREAIAKTEVIIPVGLPIHFTVYIGVTTLSNKDVNIDMLLHQADKALYEAKETGRNKVCVG